MRSNKLLFLIFLVLYFIAGLSLLITGSVAHRHATQFSEITGYSLMSGAGFIIALGVFIIVLSAAGFVGAYKNRLSLLQLFIGSLLIILVLQLIAVIVAFTLRNRAEDQLRTKLLQTLELYSGNPEVKKEWDNLQQSWSCCGVGNSSDWFNHGKRAQLPCSCYPNNACPSPSQTDVGYFPRTCYKSTLDLYFRYSKALGGVSLFFFFIEVIGLALAILLLRDLKNNYGSV